MIKKECKEGECRVNIPDLSVDEVFRKETGQKGFVKTSKIIWSFELNSRKR